VRRLQVCGPYDNLDLAGNRMLDRAAAIYDSWAADRQKLRRFLARLGFRF
jgi:hypothetical protein